MAIFLEEYERRLKTLLEEPDPLRRLVVYYGVATGLIDYEIALHPDITEINQINLTVKAEAVKVLGRLVELAIVNTSELEKAVDDTLRYRLSLVTPKAEDTAGIECVLSAFGLTNYFSHDILNGINNNPRLFADAVKCSKTYTKEYFHPTEKSKVSDLKTPEDSGVKLSVATQG